MVNNFYNQLPTLIYAENFNWVKFSFGIKRVVIYCKVIPVVSHFRVYYCSKASA